MPKSRPKPSSRLTKKAAWRPKSKLTTDASRARQVVSYSVKGAGNTWPGGEQYEVEKEVGKTSPDPNANETIWSFLSTKKIEAKSDTDKPAPDKSSADTSTPK